MTPEEQAASYLSWPGMPTYGWLYDDHKRQEHLIEALRITNGEQRGTIARLATALLAPSLSLEYGGDAVTGQSPSITTCVHCGGTGGGESGHGQWLECAPCGGDGYKRAPEVVIETFDLPQAPSSDAEVTP